MIFVKPIPYSATNDDPIITQKCVASSCAVGFYGMMLPTFFSQYRWCDILL